MNAIQHDSLCRMVLDLLNFIADIKEDAYDEHEKIAYSYSFLPEKMQQDMDNGKEITYKQVMEYLDTRRDELFKCDDSFIWGE